MMSFKTPTDFRRSMEARLKSIATKSNQDLQRIRRKVAFERLLARIFHHDSYNFVLKGGYAMELRFAAARATKDIDLTCLRRINVPRLTIEEVIIRELRNLAKVDLKDYFTFEIGPAQMDLDNPINAASFRNTLQKVYGARSTHTLSEALDPPPPEWLPLYESLAAECGLSQTMPQAYSELQEFFQTHVLKI